MELPYIAGLFDGEGTIVISGPTPSDPKKYQLRVAVAMCHEETVRQLHDALGYGTVREVDAQRYNPNASLRYDWRCSGSSALRFIRDVRPWLVTKKDAADVALRFGDTVGPKGKPLTDVQLAARRQLKNELGAVNSRGR